MSRGVGDRHLPRAGRRASVGLFSTVLVGLVGLAGCLHQQTRLQSADDNEHDRYEVKTIGDLSVVGNASPLPLGGVGLVVGLEGTGGDTPPDAYRAMLEDELRKQGEHHVKEILSSPNNALVLVTAQVPAGAAKGDPIDVEVALPRNSRATSLRGGYLRTCKLFNYDFTNHLRPDTSQPNRMLTGHPLARAEGMVLVGVTEGDSGGARRGRIWGGARCEAEAPFTLLMKDGYQSARFTSLSADRINETLQAGLSGEPSSAVAIAQDKVAVALRVPVQYRLNRPRYLRVIRLIPLNPTSEEVTGGKHRPYRQRLAEDLLDPSRTVTAALRLEALGTAGSEALKKGLQSTHPLVRFCSAEALAYLGSPVPEVGEELADAATRQPLLRAFALTALASLDQAVSHVKLRDLLTTAADDETRYGAFRALLTLNERDPAVRGEYLNESFWLHRTAAASPSLVHFSSMRRPEIVLFGQEPCLKPPFHLMAGEFCVTASEDDTGCTVSHIPRRGTPARRQCSVKLAEVLHIMADMGALYPDAVALLQQADLCGSLTSRVRCDALPQAVTVYDLVRAGRGQDSPENDTELIPAGQDLGLTPNLYDRGVPSSTDRVRQQQVLLQDSRPRSPGLPE
jgi:flagellar basal body P-ring protein FlgI